MIASSFAIIYQIGIFALSGDGTKNGLSIIYLGLWFCLYAGACIWLIFAPGLRLFAWAARRQGQ